MNEPLEKSALENRIKASLTQSEHLLDGDTQARLQAIRRAALNQPAKTSWLKLTGWLPATSLVFCSVIAMFIILPSKQAPMGALDQTAMLELLDNPEELDAMSDPDFYLWIDEVRSKNQSKNESESESSAHHAV
jgi:hypothetical protein